MEPLPSEPHPQEPQSAHRFQHTLPGSIGAIVRAFKAAVTKHCRADGYPGIIWQRNFHEHVVRNERELVAIRRYVRDNPLNWPEDPERIGR